MSDYSQAEHDKVRAQIAHLMAETVKFADEGARLRAESAQLNEDGARLRAESVKLNAETGKITKEIFWYPVMIASGLVASVAAATTAITLAVQKLLF